MFAGMPARRTHGLADPVAEFEALRPYVQQLRALQGRCRPFGPEYLALAIPLEALEEAARHFTGRRMVYGSSGEHR